MRTAHRSFRQILFKLTFDKTEFKRIDLRVDSGEITINKILTDCKDKTCIFDDSGEKQMEVQVVNPHEHNKNSGQNPYIELDEHSIGLKSIVITGIVVAAVLITVTILFIVVTKKGWWCSNQDDESETND